MMPVGERTGLMWGFCLTIQVTWRAALGAPNIALELTAGLRRFDGLGGLSAGASSRALFDYVEPHRAQVLDLVRQCTVT